MMKEKFNRRYENTMKKDGILESRKFKIAVGVINVCLIIGLAAYLIFSLISKCMRLYQDHNLNRWKFEDGYILENKFIKMVFKDVLTRAWNMPGSFCI